MQRAFGQVWRSGKLSFLHCVVRICTALHVDKFGDGSTGQVLRDGEKNTNQASQHFCILKPSWSSIGIFVFIKSLIFEIKNQLWHQDNLYKVADCKTRELGNLTTPSRGPSETHPKWRENVNGFQNLIRRSLMKCGPWFLQLFFSLNLLCFHWQQLQFLLSNNCLEMGKIVQTGEIW